MKPITKTVEETVAWEAADGTRFSNREACEKYEASAVGVAAAAVAKLTTGNVCAGTAFGDFCACYDDEIVLFDIKTVEDLNRINTLLRLQSADNEVIDPKYVGQKVAFRYYCDENYGCFHGTRADMEAEFRRLMDKLFKDGEDDAQ